MLGRHPSSDFKRTILKTSVRISMEGAGSGDAPAPDVRRKPGSSFDKAGREIGSLLFKMVPSQLETPRMIANQIRRLRKHGQTTAVERHNPSNAFYRGIEHDRDILTELCSKLVESYDGTREFTMSNEIQELCANDPGVYSLFRETLRHKFPERSANVFLAHTEIHKFWSELIGQPDHESSRYSYKHVSSLAFEYSLSVIEITLEYLAIALPLDFKTGSNKMRDLREAWTVSMEFFGKYTWYGSFRWDRVDFCVKTILDTGKQANNFLPPDCLSQIALKVARRSDSFPITLATFYAVPDVKIHRRGKQISGAEFSYAPLRKWNLADASSFAVSFTSELKKINTQRERDLLPPSKTVLSNEVWMALYHVADAVLSTYLRQNGLDFAAEYRQRRPFIDLAKALLKSLAKNNDRNYTKEGARAAFYIAQSFDIDRYCKKVVLDAFSDDIASINLLNYHARVMNRLEIPNNIYDLSFMPQFENVPYLRRFKINGECFITSDGLAGTFTRLTDGFMEQIIPGGSVETMLLDGHTLVCLRFGERFWNPQRKKMMGAPFDSTGHYPIFAGHSETGSPLYVGAVRVDERWYLSTIEEGAKQMTYFDELGEKQSSEKFFVLALRHDPSDIQPPYPRARKGAMDPTGPVFWLKFWPEKDPDYYEDSRLRDDRILGSFLNELRDRDKMERYLLGGFE